MNYNYVQAPMPFQGQKRKFLKPFKDALNGFPDDAIYVDLFGGSGLLSHTVKQYFPNAKVIYNDFDDYYLRLENVSTTNELISDIRNICSVSAKKNERLDDNLKNEIIGRISKENGFVDWVTISSNLLFSAKYVTSFDQLKKQTFYNNVRQNDYYVNGYLNGVERVKIDYKELFVRYNTNQKAVFLVDPPYLSTDCKTYTNPDYWKLSDYLDVLKTIENTSYFYFTSNKSNIIELCEWMQNNGYNKNPFDNSKKVIIGTQLNHSSSYNDIMIYKTF